MTIIQETNISGSITCHNIPEESGIYIVTDLNMEVLYVGASNCLRRRIAYLEAHVYDSSSGRFIHNASDPLLQLQSKNQQIKVHYLLCHDYKSKERELKKKYQPPWNKR